jgi:hypothetical protein
VVPNLSPAPGRVWVSEKTPKRVGYLKKFIVALIVAIAASSSAPWWWRDVFGNSTARPTPEVTVVITVQPLSSPANAIPSPQPQAVLTPAPAPRGMCPELPGSFGMPISGTWYGPFAGYSIGWFQLGGFFVWNPTRGTAQYPDPGARVQRDTWFALASSPFQVCVESLRGDVLGRSVRSLKRTPLPRPGLLEPCGERHDGFFDDGEPKGSETPSGAGSP